MNHVVLLGDSILDNAAYVGGAPEVVQQVHQRLPHGWKATLGAVDGSTTRDVPGQLRLLPADATHLILSVGGNDALGSGDFLAAPAGSTAEALLGLTEIADGFERRYRRAAAAPIQASSGASSPGAVNRGRMARAHGKRGQGSGDCWKHFSSP